MIRLLQNIRQINRISTRHDFARPILIGCRIVDKNPSDGSISFQTVGVFQSAEAARPSRHAPHLWVFTNKHGNCDPRGRYADVGKR